MINENRSFLKIINYSSLNLWDYNSQFTSDISSIYPLKKLKDYIVEESIKVDLSLDPEKDFKILGISNTDGMFDAYIKKGKEFNQKYKLVKDNWFAYNPYRINVGSIGIKSEQVQNDFISPAYVVFKCKGNLLPSYLLMILKSEFGINEIKNNTTGSVRQSLGFDRLCNITIPMPSIDEQKEIMKEFHNIEKQIEELRKALNTHTHNACEDILYKRLGISKIEVTSKKSLKFFVNDYSKISDWSYKDYDENMLNEVFKSQKYKNDKMQNIVKINPRVSLPRDKEISFVPMEVVSTENGKITKSLSKLSNQAKGYVKFQDNDIGWAKITPCMENGKCFIANNLMNGYGIGSTEFYILRANEKKVMTSYIYFLLKTDKLRKLASYYFKGTTGQKRVRKEFIEELLIPVPPLEIQKEIIDELNEIENKKENINSELKNLFLKKRNFIYDIVNL